MMGTYNPDFELPPELQLPFHDHPGVSYDDGLAVELVAMRNLHPQLVQFRNMRDLSKLSDETKKKLLRDMRRGLGLRSPNMEC